MQGKNITKLCFYFNNKNKCPQKINKMYYFGPDEYYSNLFLNITNSFEIFIAEPITLSRTLLLTSPISFFLNGDIITGNIELGVQTRLHIQKCNNLNITVNWSISTKQISKIYTTSKANSILIKTSNYEKIDTISSYKTFFYSGKETKISIANSARKISNDYNYSISYEKFIYYVKFTSNKNPKKIKEDQNKIGDNVYYETTSIGLLQQCIIINGTGPMYNFTKAPFSTTFLKKVIINEGVTTIGNYAFSSAFSLDNVTIPKSVTYIGNNAFDFCSLLNIKIPDSVLYIGESSFFHCELLETVEMSQKVYHIGQMAFRDCSSLQSLKLYNEIETISPSTFRGCYKLHSLDLNDCNKLNKIESLAFRECISLNMLTLPENVQFIESSAFYGCTNLISITVSDKITEFSSQIFAYCCSLNSITFSESLEKIGEKAFYYCCSLESINIPKSVASIGDSAFVNCFQLSSFIVDENNQFYSTIDGNILSSKSKDLLYNYPPNKLIESYEIPDYITGLAKYCFSYCINIKYLTVPSSISQISAYSFQHCHKLESITFLGSHTFESHCFDYCYDLISIVYYGTTTVYNSKIFISEYNKMSIYVPSNFADNKFCDYDEVVKTNDLSCRSIHHKCIECNNNLCDKCEEGWKIESGKCIQNCELVTENCNKCTSKNECLACKEGFVLDNGKCISNNICDNIIENCGVCHQSSENFYCDNCFDTFELSSDKLKCNKEISFSFPSKKEPIEIFDDVNVLNTANCQVTNRKMTIKLALGNIVNQTHNIEIMKDINDIYIETARYMKLNLVFPPLESTNDEIKVNYSDSSFDVMINCPRGSIISTEKDSIELLRGSRTIQIRKPTKIDKILLDEINSDKMILKKIGNNNYDIDEIQVKHSQKFLSESSNVKKIKIHPFSELTLENTIVETAEIGFSSSLTVRNNKTVVSHFKIFPAFYNFNKIPVKFHQPFPKLDESDIQFDESQSIILEDFTNTFVAAKFIGENEDANLNACKSLKFINENITYNTKCEKDEFGPNYNLFVVFSIEKVDSKDKIVAGEYASYIIGAIVFAVIIVLAICFIVLNIKNKTCKQKVENPQ